MSVEQRNSSKLLLGIIGALVTVVILVFAYQWLNTTTTQKTSVQQDELNQKPKQPTPIEAKQAALESASSEPVESTKVLVQADIVDAPVPTNPALAKEELAKLEDIQKQLHEQQLILNAQHQDANALIKLKEEQIKLLEAQLAEGS